MTKIEIIPSIDDELTSLMKQKNEVKKILEEVLGYKIEGEVTMENLNEITEESQKNIDKMEKNLEKYKKKFSKLSSKKNKEEERMSKINKIKGNLPIIEDIKKLSQSDRPFQERIGEIFMKLTELGNKEDINSFALSGINQEDSWDLREYLEDNKGRRMTKGQRILNSIVGMDDQEAWDLREKYFSNRAEYKEDEDNEWIIDVLDIYLKSLMGIDNERAWEIREKFFNFDGATPRCRSRSSSGLYESTVKRYDNNFELPGLIMSLVGIDTERAWEMREQVLNKLEEKGKGYSYNLETAVIRSLKGIDTERAWEMRKRLIKLGADEKDVLYSIMKISTPDAWQIRYKILNKERKYRGKLIESKRDIDDICMFLTGLDDEESWKLRLDFLNQGYIKEVISSLGGLDTERAWNLRIYGIENGIDTNTILFSLRGGSFGF